MSTTNGQPPDRKSTAIPDYVVKQIRRLRFREGRSIPDIVRITGRAKSTVEKYCRELALPDKDNPDQ